MKKSERASSVVLPPIEPSDGRRKNKAVTLQVPTETLISKQSLPPILPIRPPTVIQKPRKMYVRPQCNYIPEVSSEESVPTPLPDHWKDPLPRVPRSRASVSEIQAQPKRSDDEKQQRDSVEEETDAVLPRTFFPLGVDWDTNLELQGYGQDVTLKSESSLSSDEDYDPNPENYFTSEFFHYSKRVAENEPPTQSIETDSSSEEIIRKRVQMKQEPPSIDFGENWRDDGFFQMLQAARKQRRLENQKRAKCESHYRTLNDEVRTDGPRIARKEWRVDDPQPMKIMRKGTVKSTSMDEIYRTLKNEGMRPSLTFNEYVEQLNTMKEELERLDKTQKTMITEGFLTEFCYKNAFSRSTDLVLQGKEVYDKINRRIQDFDLPCIFLFLLKRRDITYLDLCYNNLTGEGMRLIADFLAWDKGIVGLNLMNNDIENLDSPGIDSMTENTTLRSLRLNGNPIGKKGGEYLAFVIMFKNLEHLDLGQTDQEVRSLMWITQALIKNEKLKVLDLSRVLPGLIHCGSESFLLASAVAFSDILRMNTSLVELHLQKNGVSDIAMEEIVFGLGFNRTLELLDLSFNQIGDEGARLISNSLHRGAPLKALMLAGNNIGDVGARALSLQLPKSQLKLLNLANNKIKDPGIMDIVQCCRKPDPLLALFIFGNPFGSRALEVINTEINGGSLEFVELDIQLHHWEGVIGHGRNMTADRYGARYYQVAGHRRNEAKLAKSQQQCKNTTTVYKYHNVFKPREPQPFLPLIRTNMRGSCCPR